MGEHSPLKAGNHRRNHSPAQPNPMNRHTNIHAYIQYIPRPRGKASPKKRGVGVGVDVDGDGRGDVDPTFTATQFLIGRCHAGRVSFMHAGENGGVGWQNCRNACILIQLSE
jgi:hypothetical protein